MARCPTIGTIPIPFQTKETVLANVLPIISQQGPLPITATVKVMSDGPMVLMLSGSVWTNTAGSMIGAEVLLDGAKVAVASIFANAGATHMAFVPIVVPLATTIGSHTFEIIPLNTNTVSDLNDNYSLTLLF